MTAEVLRDLLSKETLDYMGERLKDPVVLSAFVDEIKKLTKEQTLREAASVAWVILAEEDEGSNYMARKVKRAILAMMEADDDG